MSECFNPPLKDVSSTPELSSARAVLEELVSMYDEARSEGLPDIRSAVGAKFESRARLALAALEAEATRT